MTELQRKEQIAAALQGAGEENLRTGALRLLEALGYSSEKRLDLSPNSAATFCAEFDPQGRLNERYALTAEWRSVDLLFQLTEEEVRNTWQGNLGFDKGRVDNTIIESYLFFAIDLKGDRYARTKLSGITREVNKLFPMPVMVLFRYAGALTVSVIKREIHKRDETRDVMRKVTLIKDIDLADPIRAHIDILFDLSFPALVEEFAVHNFVGLHRAWEKRLDSYQLNERFYKDIANWYFWALRHEEVAFPRDVETGSAEQREEKRSIFFIRLITRLVFCWFLQEKGLIPRALFRAGALKSLVKETKANAGSYYRAILQNLFFATLNQEVDKRQFRDKKDKGWYDSNRGVTNLFRYEDLLADPVALVSLLKSVPFVNGGLFDCLDSVFKKSENRANVRLDGFSDNPKESCSLPNELFFGDERSIDLSDVYDDKRRKSEKVRGLIEILSRYKFTVEESTPLEQEVALDPELLGKVFENLLASYNRDTRTTARKATGSFYTPREVVSYMVDEALLAYLRGHLDPTSQNPDLETILRPLFAPSEDALQTPLGQSQVEALIAAIDNVKVLDPACGSGAFPMGVLHRLVDLLGKLDPNNNRWKEQQRQRAIRDRSLAEQMEDEENREQALRNIEMRIADIEKSFNTRFHDLDFARKLYLIENSIYGVDIQPIACQIAKLRFFIALIVDQRVDRSLPNSGVRPLPNLETRIVAADALMPVERVEKHQMVLGVDAVKNLRESLDLVRHEHFNARTPDRKAKCRAKDAAIRVELAAELEKLGMPNRSASLLAGWDPYDQNNHAQFFDPEWMFSLKGGFDVVIGNPPYVRQEQLKDIKPKLKEKYDCFSGTADLYVYFYERGIQLLKAGGAFSFITSHKWFRSAYGEKLRIWLNWNTNLERLIDFGDTPVFTAIAYPCIIILTRSPARPVDSQPTENRFKALNWSLEWRIEDINPVFAANSFEMPQASLLKDGWRLERGSKRRLLDRIAKTGLRLDKYAKDRIYYGIKTGFNEAFVVNRATRDQLIDEHPSSAEILRPFLRGRDVKRWRTEYQDLWLIFTRRGIDIKKYPAIQKRLKGLRRELEPCPADWEAKKDGVWPGRKPGTYEWYEIQDNIAYWKEFEKPKIVVPAITDAVNYAFDGYGYYSNDKTSIVIPPSLPYTLAVMNSNVSWWFTQQTFASKQGGFYEFKPMYFSQLPIPQPPAANQELVEAIAEYVIWLNRWSAPDNHGPVAGFFEQLLNGLVYELFFEPELHEKRLYLLKYLAESKPPRIAGLSEEKKGSSVTEFYQKASDINHPVRSCLLSLPALEVVRIIEGAE